MKLHERNLDHHAGAFGGISASFTPSLAITRIEASLAPLRKAL